MNEVVNLPLFNVGNLELQVFMITVVFVDYIS